MTKEENDLHAVKTAFIKRYGYEGSKIDKDLAALEKVFFTRCFAQFSKALRAVDMPTEQKLELLNSLTKVGTVICCLYV